MRRTKSEANETIQAAEGSQNTFHGKGYANAALEEIADEAKVTAVRCIIILRINKGCFLPYLN